MVRKFIPFKESPFNLTLTNLLIFENLSKRNALVLTA